VIEEQFSEVPGRIVVANELILRPGLAVNDMAVAPHKLLNKFARFGRKRMFIPVARSVQPPNLSHRRIGYKRVKHCQQRSGSNARAHQHDRLIAKL
jgi:hypothetical protein